MHGAALQELAIRTATELPDATHEHPFGPEWDVLKVSGKVFLLVTEAPGEPVAVRDSYLLCSTDCPGPGVRSCPTTCARADALSREPARASPGSGHRARATTSSVPPGAWSASATLRIAGSSYVFQ